MKEFCVFRQTYKNGENLIFYGKVSRRFIPRLKDYEPAEKFVEVLELAGTLAEAARLYNVYIWRRPVEVRTPIGLRYYRSVDDTADATGLHMKTIINALDGRPKYRRPRGLTFHLVSRETAQYVEYNEPWDDRILLEDWWAREAKTGAAKYLFRGRPRRDS